MLDTVASGLQMHPAIDGPEGGARGALASTRGSKKKPWEKSLVHWGQKKKKVGRYGIRTRARGAEQFSRLPSYPLDESSDPDALDGGFCFLKAVLPAWFSAHPMGNGISWEKDVTSDPQT